MSYNILPKNNTKRATNVVFHFNFLLLPLTALHLFGINAALFRPARSLI
jgi:hypothetical protein